MQPALVILAGGLGSRFGGTKQLTPVGPGGEVLFDYSASDARRAGFGRIVLLTRSDIEGEISDHVHRRWPAHVDVRIVCQDADDRARAGVAAGRVKPLGTAHAALVGMRAADGAPVAVINADDLYGATPFRLLFELLEREPAAALVTFPIGRTVIDTNAVTRALCSVAASGELGSIEEGTFDPLAAEWVGFSGRRVAVAGAEPVSMNFWGFGPSVADMFAEATDRLLASDQVAGSAEVLLPEVVRSIIPGGEVIAREFDGPCVGLTHRSDLGRLREMVDAVIW